MVAPIKLSRKLLEVIAGVVTGDNDIAPYRTASELNAFWEDIELDISQCDFSQVTSRKKGVLAVLSHYNRNGQIFEILNMIISEVLNFQNFLDERNKDKSRQEIAEYLNGYLSYSDLIIEGKKDYNNRPDTYSLKRLNQNIITSDKVEKLNHDFVGDQRKKIVDKIQTGDYDGAITNSRTLVEAVMQEILKKHGKSETELEKDLDELYKMLKKEMKLSASSDLESVFKQILSGLQSLISGFSSLGNKMSERHATKYRSSKHHAELAANSAYTISEFLLSSYEHQKKINKND